MNVEDYQSIIKIKNQLQINSGAGKLLEECSGMELPRLFGSLFSIFGSAGTGRSILVADLLKYLLSLNLKCSLYSRDISPLLSSLTEKHPQSFKLHLIDGSPYLDGTFTNIFKLMKEDDSEVIALDPFFALRTDKDDSASLSGSAGDGQFKDLSYTLAANDKFFILTNSLYRSVANGIQTGGPTSIQRCSSVICYLDSKPEVKQNFLFSNVEIIKSRFVQPNSDRKIRIQIPYK